MLHGFIQEVGASRPEGSDRLRVAIRHVHEGRTYEVFVEVERVEFHGVPVREEARGGATAYVVGLPDLVAVVVGATLHVCPRGLLRDVAQIAGRAPSEPHPRAEGGARGPAERLVD